MVEDAGEELLLGHLPALAEPQGPVQAAVGEREQGPEGLHHPLAAHRHRRHHGRADHLAQVAELVLAAGVGQVALVELDDDGQGPVVEPVRLQVLQHVVPVGQRGGRLAAAAVGHEDDGVGPLQHDAPGRLVDHLARHRVELELHLDAGLGLEEDRHHVEEEGPVVLGVQRHEPAADLRGDLLVERLEVGGLAGERRAVIDDLDRQLARLVVELDHGPRLRPSIAAPPLRSSTQPTARDQGRAGAGGPAPPAPATAVRRLRHRLGRPRRFD